MKNVKHAIEKADAVFDKAIHKLHVLVIGEIWVVDDKKDDSVAKLVDGVYGPRHSKYGSRPEAKLAAKVIFAPIWVGYRATQLVFEWSTSKPVPSMDKLVEAVDWFPVPKTRKLLRKMVSEQGVHIDELAKKGRINAAKAQWYMSWGLLGWYGLRGLVTSIAKAVRGMAS